MLVKENREKKSPETSKLECGKFPWRNNNQKLWKIRLCTREPIQN